MPSVRRIAALLAVAALAAGPAACGEDDARETGRDIEREAKQGSEKVKKEARELERDVEKELR